MTLDGFSFLRVDQRDARTFETRSAETTAINAVRLTHNLIQCYQFRRPAFVVVDGAFTTLEYQLPECTDVATRPGFHAGLHTVALCEEMAGTTGKAFRHDRLVAQKLIFCHITQPGVLQFLQSAVLVSFHNPGCRFTF